MNTACYLISRTLSPAIGFKTPDELWHGKLSDYSDLKVFGCEVYAHVKQDKLDPRAVKCIFIGYPKGVKHYMLWCVEPRNHRCIISRDATFNEQVMGYKSGEQPQDLNGDISEEVS